jgi:RNA recognition motif-containing protein
MLMAALPNTNPERITMNIYVGNLSFNTTDDDLNEAFGRHGQVESARVVSDRVTGRSRGFGFVEMPNGNEAQAAISAMNNTDLQGRSITANEARPREERSSRGGSHSRY